MSNKNGFTTCVSAQATGASTGCETALTNGPTNCVSAHAPGASTGCETALTNGRTTCVSAHATGARTGCETSPRKPGEAGDPAGTVVRGERWWRTRRRVALLAWAVLVVVIWNVVFDRVVTRSGLDYLTQQALHQAGKGPAVTIPDVMRPGIAHGVRLASLAAGGVAVIGALLFWAAARHHRRLVQPR